MPKDPQYVITVDDTGLTVTPLEGDAAVVFTAAPADAEAMQSGALDLNVAFMQGRVKAAGDMRELFALLRRARG
jgi:putative sterol carrier protein